MIRASRADMILASLLGIGLFLWPCVLRAASFTVQDVRASREIGESTELYIDGRLIRAFRLDDGQPRIELSVKVPERRDHAGHEIHSYGLCGTITVRTAEGGSETHEVNASGLLHDPNGHRFEALGAENFTRFYLADPDDPDTVQTTAMHSGLCREPIS